MCLAKVHKLRRTFLQSSSATDVKIASVQLGTQVETTSDLSENSNMQISNSFDSALLAEESIVIRDAAGAV